MVYALSRNSLLWVMLFLIVGSISSCSWLGRLGEKPQQPVSSNDLNAVLSGQAILGRTVVPSELPNLDLFSITPEMASFASQAVKRANTTFEKVKALHYALLLPVEEGGRGVVYNAYSTQVPTVSFQERSVNCLSFSLLYVALAHHLKLDAKINEVQTPPVWNLRDKGSLFLMRHVNVKVPLRDEKWVSANSDDAVIDLEMGRYKSTYSQHYISDAVVAAQFYSNRGMEIAAEGRQEEAFLYLRKALQEDDQQSHIWNNFASFYIQQNLLHEAEIIYLHGLELQPDDLSIMTNLAGLYHKMGNTDKANRYSKLAQRHRDANPYYQYTLALSAFDSDDFGNALLYIKRAIDREKNEPRFYQLASTVYTQLGKANEAESMNAKYEKLRSQK